MDYPFGAADAPSTDSAAALVRNNLFINCKRSTTPSSDCISVQAASGGCDTQQFDSDLAIGHDIGKSPNLSRSRIGWWDTSVP
jgi:hypothetical protein